MSKALIKWISGPVLRAQAQGVFFINEAVRVGEQNLLGEVIRIQEQEITAQVYEDTSGLQLSYRYGDTYSPGLDQVEPLKTECQHFIECIRLHRNVKTR